MTSTKFLIYDSLEKVQFFEEIFLLTNTSMEIVLELSFFSLNNADLEFAEPGKFIQRFYITIKALPTTSRVKLTNKRDFAKAALDKNSKTFIIYIVTLDAMPIYLSRFLQVQSLDKSTLAVLQ